MRIGRHAAGEWIIIGVCTPYSARCSDHLPLLPVRRVVGGGVKWHVTGGDENDGPYRTPYRTPYRIMVRYRPRSETVSPYRL
jgi:hypothetical protein